MQPVPSATSTRSRASANANIFCECSDMQLPLTLFRRGLLGFMDEQDQAQSRAETSLAASPDDAFREPTIDYLGRQLSLAGRHIVMNPMSLRLPTWDPVSGGLNIVPYAKSVGERSFDRWSKLPLPTGISPPGPTASAPVTAIPRPGFLFGVPPVAGSGQSQTDEAGNDAYHLPPELDEGEIEGGGGARKVKGGGRYFPSSAENGPLDGEPPHVKQSFRSGSYYENTPAEPVELYRSWGQDWKGDPNRQFGPYWVRQEPRGPGELMIDEAIKPSWNDFRNLTKIRIPPGEVQALYEGLAARHDNLAGGGWQVYIPEGVDLSKWEVWTRPFR